MWPMRRLLFQGVTFLRVRGIPVEAHWSLVIGIVLQVNWLAGTRFLGRYPELTDATITAMTIGSVLLLPASILLHELGHCFQARREGMGVERITLWFLGGLAWLSGPPRSQGADFRVTAAGPVVTAVLVVLFGALGWLGGRVGWPDPVVGVTVLLAQINAFILAFNLMPVFPLDGGRISYSALLRLRGPAFAAAWTSRVGTALAVLVLAFGMVGPFIGVLAPPFESSGPRYSGALDSSSFMLIGLLMLWFTRSIRPPAELAGGGLRGLAVGDLLGPRLAPAAEATVAGFLESMTRVKGYRTSPFPVLEGMRVVGVISPGVADQVPAEGRENTTVGDVMLRKGDAVELKLETPLEEAYRALKDGSGRGVVLDGNRVAGIVCVSDLAEVMLRIADGTQEAVVSTTSSWNGEVGW